MEGWNAGISYSSGPFGVSLAWFNGERDGGSNGVKTYLAAEMNTVHLSGKYALGPGVTAAATLGYNEITDESSGADGSNDNDGVYIVSGVKLSF
jgi:predicted porin